MKSCPSSSMKEDSFSVPERMSKRGPTSFPTALYKTDIKSVLETKPGNYYSPFLKNLGMEAKGQAM